MAAKVQRGPKEEVGYTCSQCKNGRCRNCCSLRCSCTHPKLKKETTNASAA